jgi:hypothetical protein
MFTGSRIGVEEACTVADEEITYEFMSRTQCSPQALQAAELTPWLLRNRGVDEAFKFRVLGFDALHLLEEEFCRELIALFSVSVVHSTFICTDGDAVVVAGSEVQRLLNIATSDLIDLCIGSPIHAGSVLQQCTAAEGVSHVLKSITADALLNTCIRSARLKECGLTMAHVRRDTNATSVQLRMMGFLIEL